MIAKELKDGEWYDVRIIGLRYVLVGENQRPAVEVAVRFADNSQESVKLFLTPAAMANTHKSLIDLGCTRQELRDDNWLHFVNVRLANAPAACPAKVTEKYGKQLSGLYPRRSASKVVEVAAPRSPFLSDDTWAGGVFGDSDEVPF